MPDIRILDPHLAPDRRGGLFVAADAIYVEDGWPDARALMRDATNCGRAVLRSAEALERWVESITLDQ